MSLRFDDDARAEFHEAAAYYEEREDGLGSDFVQKVKDAVGRILNDVRGKKRRGVHTWRLERFPFRIVYHVRGENVTIVAVMHMHRDPDYWKGRLRGL